jgi:hypothetical protein
MKNHCRFVTSRKECSSANLSQKVTSAEALRNWAVLQDNDDANVRRESFLCHTCGIPRGRGHHPLERKQRNTEQNMSPEREREARESERERERERER